MQNTKHHQGNCGKRILLTAAAAISMAIFHPAQAAQPTVEIISLQHWPVQQALTPIRAMLDKYKGKIKVIELNAEEPDGIKELKSAGKKGHIPILVLIDGKYQFKRADGTTVAFENFPASSNNPMGLNGTWRALVIRCPLS